MRIGLQIAKLEYGYGVKIWQSAMVYAKEIQADLIIFPGRNLNTPHGFDYQYNSIFRFMNKENLDALILVSTLVTNYVNKSAMLDFCSQFKNIPIVSLGLKLPGIPSIIIDNRSGIRDIVKHMIEVHNAKNIAFIRGPALNWEANERYEAYCEEIKAHGIPFNENLIGHGDFTFQSVEPALNVILSKNRTIPDAFIFANDEMAIHGMKILRKKGIIIPEMTSVTGFDDISEASNLINPLTTIEQQQEQMAIVAINLIKDLVDGKQVDDITILPTKAVIRSTCGCKLQCLEEANAIDFDILERIRLGNNNMLDSVVSSLEAKGFSRFLTTQRKERIQRTIQNLIEICKSGENLHVESKYSLISEFEEILKSDLVEGNNPDDWNFIFHAITTTIENVNDKQIDINRFRSLSHSYLMIINEFAILYQRVINSRKSETNITLRDILNRLFSITHTKNLAQAIHEQLPRIGIKTFFLSLFDREFTHERLSPWEIPDKIRFITGMVDGNMVIDLDNTNMVYDSNLIIPPQCTIELSSRTLTVLPLFFRDTQYGTIVFEMSNFDGFIYETLATQISTILLFNSKEKVEEKLRQAMQILETTNIQLSELSLKDELTGLYNRRGFIQLVSQQLYLNRQTGKSCLIIFGDIDNLKTINDTYGHKEGDYTIRRIGEILKQAFREIDIVSRFGGDEFTIFAANAGKAQIRIFNDRITELLANENKISSKPYKLSISLGFSVSESDSGIRLEDLIREADINQYNNKMLRKNANI
jgi:diguanylate cyclase (GGDEF)-like protein